MGEVKSILESICESIKQKEIRKVKLLQRRHEVDSR